MPPVHPVLGLVETADPGFTLSHEKEWCIRVLENHLRSEAQEKNCYRFWGRIEELGDRVLRVVTLADKVTVHNAFPDRGFKP